MAFPTAVNDQITDSVSTGSGTKKKRAKPAAPRKAQKRSTGNAKVSPAKPKKRR